MQLINLNNKLSNFFIGLHLVLVLTKGKSNGTYIFIFMIENLENKCIPQSQIHLVNV